MNAVKVRKGQAPPSLKREEFRRRFVTLFNDPAYRRDPATVGSIEAIAWDAYKEGRKAPVTRKAGRGFADPSYDLSVEWYATHQRLRRAERLQKRPGTRSRVLIVAGAARNDGTCPGEISKTIRLARMMREEIAAASMEADLLDLSLLTSEPALRIFPCKGCVSTAMPLCHWPCSCYPNHALRPDQRLDGRDLRALGRRARRHRRDAGLLVPGAEHAQAHDGPPGVRRRRQPGSDVHEGQGSREGQSGGACRLGLSEAPRRPRVRRVRARRRRRHGVRAPRAAPTGSTGWA